MWQEKSFKDDMTEYLEVSPTSTASTLLETSGAKSISFNAEKFVCKSQDCNFFGGNLPSEGYKVDSKRIQAITEMKPPQNLQDLQSYLAIVNYLNHFSLKFAELTATLEHSARGTQSSSRKAHNKQHLKPSERRSQMHHSWPILTSKNPVSSSQMHPKVY